MNRLAFPVASLVVVVLVTTACGGETTTTTTSAPATTATATSEIPLTTTPPVPRSYEDFRAQPTACGAEAPPAARPMSFTEPEDVGLDPRTPVAVTLVTSCGDIVAELDPGMAPATVNSFVFLAENGYFDGTASHRVVPGFVIQAGDPEATGFGGPGYNLPDEFPEPETPFPRGTVAMANAGLPETTGSQFFIVLSDLIFPAEFNFTVIGRVIEGFDTMDTIESLPLGLNASGEPSTPLETLYLERVTIDR